MFSSRSLQIYSFSEETIKSALYQDACFGHVGLHVRLLMEQA